MKTNLGVDHSKDNDNDYDQQDEKQHFIAEDLNDDNISAKKQQTTILSSMKDVEMNKYSSQAATQQNEQSQHLDDSYSRESNGIDDYKSNPSAVSKQFQDNAQGNTNMEGDQMVESLHTGNQELNQMISRSKLKEQKSETKLTKLRNDNQNNSQAITSITPSKIDTIRNEDTHKLTTNESNEEAYGQKGEPSGDSVKEQENKYQKANNIVNTEIDSDKKKKPKKGNTKQIEKQRPISRSNSENHSDMQQEEEEKIVRRDTEKKRGIRDLSTEEKWGVYANYAEMQSLRGVGRMYNMDHSTVKLLIQRINNERPGQTMTKELFLETSLAQPAYEQPLVKKNKKDIKKEEQQLKKEKEIHVFADSQGYEFEECQGNNTNGGEGGYEMSGITIRNSSEQTKTKKASKYIAKKHKTLEHYASTYENINENNGYGEYTPHQLGNELEQQAPLMYQQANHDAAYTEQIIDNSKELAGSNVIEKKDSRKKLCKNDKTPQLSKKNKVKGTMGYFQEGQIHLSDPDSILNNDPAGIAGQHIQTHGNHTKSGFDEHHFLDNYELLAQINPENNLFYGQQAHQLDHQGNKDEFDINLEHFDFSNNYQQHQQHNNQPQYDEIKLDLS